MIRKRLADVIPGPPLWLMVAESRALLESTALIPLLPTLRKVPMGDGHPVLVLPGFLATSRSTLLLRAFLHDRGYAAHRWKLGRNAGYQPNLEKGIIARIRELADRYDSTVSLVGWSLGGIYAREAARELPHLVRQVITMGSPFGADGKGTNVGWLYEMISGHSPHTMGRPYFEKMRQPPPVPTTAIFSRTDGIASWRTTVELITHAQVENVEVGGAHIGLGFNPRALLVIGDRLAQDPDRWEPFEPRGLWRLMFGEVQNFLSERRKRPFGTALADLREALDKLEDGMQARLSTPPQFRKRPSLNLIR